ncbi:uncharacterized protein FOMMEDRAFT_150768 [Fomitiporia mediterranea MF3/22]|uniref:uncharacterized protein n=1 Tax=Fomitiporia mediterranea (strain MF3/22) TaxID=694068 RepID=UPI00044088E1|nr:uncharacterized protein FOMMEDRAFT_150768 [Fomitiporia mediterranea MF3/22]EJD08092.1 hypothetical protein FOMMEDRAFT_150768 [Fomitiporia mediterranea MF3/22]
MTSLRDYLRDHAKFYCPPVAPPSHRSEFTAVTDIEVEVVLSRLDSHYTVIEARRDAQLVDALINALNELGKNPIPKYIEGEFEWLYSSDMQGICDVRRKPNAKLKFSMRHLNLLRSIMISLGHPIGIGNKHEAPGVGTKVDILLSTREDKKALVDIKALDVFDLAAEDLSELSHAEVGLYIPLDLQTPETGMKVIIKVFLYMELFGEEWLGLTCYTKWVFFRLHSRGVGELPYITYSTVEKLDNTRAFRASLGMLLAIAREIDVPSNADMNGRLRPIPATKEPSDTSTLPEQRYSSFKGGAQVTNSEPPLTRSQKKCDNSSTLSSYFLVTWSPKTFQHRRWLEFRAVDTNDFPALGNDHVRLCVLGCAGRGSTGIVYEAISEGDELEGASEPRRYAIKTVGKGETLEEESCAKRLFKELDVYRRIAQRSSGPVKAIPQFYGLFETSQTWALLMDYEGNVLKHDGEWSELSPTEKQDLYDALSTLHGLGIYHCDFEPRNVVRCSDGSLKIIDFTSSYFHKCRGDVSILLLSYSRFLTNG